MLMVSLMVFGVFVSSPSNALLGSGTDRLFGFLECFLFRFPVPEAFVAGLCSCLFSLFSPPPALHNTPVLCGVLVVVCMYILLLCAQVECGCGSAQDRFAVDVAQATGYQLLLFTITILLLVLKTFH